MLVLTFQSFESFFIQNCFFQVIKTKDDLWAIRTQAGEIFYLNEDEDKEIYSKCYARIKNLGQQVKISFQADKSIKIIRGTIKDEEYSDTLCMPNVTERTIDQILEEEFIINHDFFGQFLSLLFEDSLTEGARVTEAYRSVTQTRSGGDESDIIVLFEQGDKSYAILIENKITASKQEKQPERYIERGVSGIRGGLWDSFETVLIAPNSYIEARKDHDQFHNYVSYERIIQILDTTISDERRRKYRKDAFWDAIQKKQQYVRLPDIEEVVDFVEHFKKDSEGSLNSMDMNFDPPNKKVIWFYFNRKEYPVGVQIIVQYESVVAQIKASHFHLLNAEVIDSFQKNGFFQQDAKSGKSTTFRKVTDKVNCLKPYYAQRENMMRCLAIVKELDGLILNNLK